MATEKEKLEIEYEEKELALRKNIEEEYNKKIELLKKDFEKQLAEKEDIIKTKLELESRKNLEILRERYDVELRSKEIELKKVLDIEYKRKYETELKKKLAELGKKCELVTAIPKIPYPFTAIVGQEVAKKALLLNAIDPKIGGVLLWGPKGVGKSTAIRALCEKYPDPDEVECIYGLKPPRCWDCEKRYEIGSISTENYSIQYFKDILLNCVSLSTETTESGFIHPNKIIVSTKSTEVAEKMQSFNTLPIQIEVKPMKDLEQRTEILRRYKAFLTNPEDFRKKFTSYQDKLWDRMVKAKRILPLVTIPPEITKLMLKSLDEININSHNIEILIERVSAANAAYEGRHRVTVDDIVESSNLVLLYTWGRKIPEREKIGGGQLEAIIRMTAKA